LHLNYLSMIAIQQTPLPFFFSSSTEKESKPAVNSFDKEIEQIMEQSIDLTITDKLKDKLLAMRYAVLSQDKEAINQLPNYVIGEIIANYYKQSKDNTLSKMVSQTLEIHLAMLENNTLNNAINIATSNLPTLSGLKELHNLYPYTELNNLIEWLNYSLSFEFYLIMADKVINQKIAMDKDKITLLEQLLKTNCINFAAYGKIIGFWNFPHNIENQLLRNIKIKASALEADTNKGKLYSMDELKQLIAA
jgi:hypothetical protein